MSEFPEKVCYACMRIDGKQFYRELRELGFMAKDATEIASWIRLIYEYRDATKSGASFLSGKQAHVIKSCLAYIGSKELGNHRYSDITLRRIRILYGIEFPGTLQMSYRKYLDFLQKAKPEAFKLPMDFRFKDSVTSETDPSISTVLGKKD